MVKKTASLFIVSVLVFTGATCIFYRISQLEIAKETAYMAAALSMPDGVSSFGKSNEKNPETLTVPETSSPEEKSTLPLYNDEEVFSEDAEKYSSQTKYPILEMQYSDGDIGYNDFFVKNSTDYDLDIEKYLSAPLGFKIKNDNTKVQVLIVHTHTTESYLTYDNGFYHENFHSRSEDPEKNLLRVGRTLVSTLRKNGIGAVQACTVHDSPQYDGAYARSRATIEEYLEQYPDIKVIIDLHRDSISYGDGGKVKPTFTVAGRKAAQIMIMAGYDPDGYYDFPFWEDNLSFALKLQDTAEKMYPGMTRPLYFGNFAYNMNVNNGSLLIETGTDANTLAEAVYTAQLLGNVLTEVLQRS